VKNEHVVLARKYRPQGFDELLGQPAVSVTLKNALNSKRLHHAYLFTGPRGVGKTTMARILAKALNCVKGPTAEPCGSCDPCREITASSCLDVLEMDAASHTGVDNVRQVIIETVALAPSRDRYKVFIIDEAHMLSSQAFNALLKTIEEPPPHVVFVLATTESAKVPATIASRCQRFKFRPVPVELLASHLASLAKKEKLKAEPAALELLARNAEGSLRDAVSLLDQCRSAGGAEVTEALVRDMFGLVAQDRLAGVAKALLTRDARSLAMAIKTLNEEGIESAQLLRDLRGVFEALYLKSLGVEAPVDAAYADLSGTSEQYSFLLRRLNKTLEDLRFGDSPRLTLELGLFGCLEAAGDLEAWVKRLEDLERRLSSGMAPAAPKPAEEVVSRSISAGGWSDVVAAIQGERPALAALLEKARVEQGPAAWKLIFSNSFEMGQAERGRALIEAKLATALGKTMRIVLEVGQSGHTSQELTSPSVESSPALEGTWRDAGESLPKSPTDPGLSKAQQILGGKVRIVKKPQ
jgi:DNA polymerase III subunit gamma/tau